MKDLNNRKIRPRHQIIKILRDAEGQPVEVNVLRDQLEILIPVGGRRDADTGFLSLSSYISSIRLDDGNVVKTMKTVNDVRSSYYALVNYWAFDAKGHRYVTPAGNRMLRDDEIKVMLAEQTETESNEPGYVSENGERYDTLNSDASVVCANTGLTFYQSDVMPSVETSTDEVEGPIDAMTLFIDDTDEVVNEPDLSESDDVVDLTDLVDNTFPLDSIDVEPYVSPKTSARKRGPNGHFLPRESLAA